MSKKPFKPQVIGQPNFKKRDGILDLAEAILETVNDLYDALLLLFPDSTVTFDELKDYISADKPEKLLRKKYIIDQGIEIRGLKMKTLLDIDLLDIPETLFDLSLSNILVIHDLLAEIKPDYNPIPYMKVDEDSTVYIDPKYLEKVAANTQEVTQNEYQNQVLAHIESVRDSLNALIELNAISPRAGTKHMLFRFGDAFLRNRFDHIPTQIDPNMFRVNTIPPIKRQRIGQKL